MRCLVRTRVFKYIQDFKENSIATKRGNASLRRVEITKTKADSKLSAGRMVGLMHWRAHSSLI